MTHPHPEKDFSTDETPVEESSQEPRQHTVEESLANRPGLSAAETAVPAPIVDEEVTASDEVDGDNEVVGTEEAAATEGSTAVDEAPVKESRSPILPLVCLGVGLLTGFLGQYAVTGVQDIIKAQTATVFSTAVSDCNLEKHDGVTLSNNNKTLTVDTKGKKDDHGASEQNAGCIVQALSIPNDVMKKVVTTKMDSPQQSADWDGKTVTWEFSTDKGIQLEFKINS